MRGFSKGIKQFAPLLIVELHSPEQDKEVGNFLKENGYSAYRFDTFKKLEFTFIKDLDKVYPSADGIWGSIFCIPPGKKLDDFTFDK